MRKVLARLSGEADCLICAYADCLIVDVFTECIDVHVSADCTDVRKTYLNVHVHAGSKQGFEGEGGSAADASCH